MVDVEARLMTELGVERLASVTGGSMGGMQALAWAQRYPERVASVMAIATTWRLGAQAIAFNEVGRTAILGDPEFRGGDYYDVGQPHHGLATARMVGHITYLSDESMRKKFGRRLRERDALAFDFVTEFEVESYLAYQGKKFVERFDANTYLYMTKAMDYFDLSAGRDRLAEAFEGALQRYLVLSFSSDWLFTTRQSRDIVDALQVAGAAGLVRRDPQSVRARRVPAGARGAAAVHRAVPRERGRRGAARAAAPARRNGGCARDATTTGHNGARHPARRPPARSRRWCPRAAACSTWAVATVR